MPSEEKLYDLAELFKVFGDSTRIRILYVLFESGAYAYRGYAGNVVDRVLKLNLPKMESYEEEKTLLNIE